MKTGVRIPDRRITWPARHDPESAAVFAQNTIEITASAKTIWSLLIDCMSWPSWYKRCADVTILRGGPVLETDTKFRFKTLGLYFEPEIENFEPYRELSWSAKGPAGTSGAHAWYIEERPGSCHVITEEAQKGLLLAVVGGRTRRNLLESHEEWLRGLKDLAELREG